MRLKLLDFIEECGGLRQAAEQLRIPALLLGDMALGCEPMMAYVETALDKATNPDASGQAALRAFMRWKGVTINEAAILLGVGVSYLRQQAGMRQPTGAVMWALREQLARKDEPQLSREEMLAQQVAQPRRSRAGLRRTAAAQKRAEIDAHNARVIAERIAERQARKKQKP